MRGFLRAAGFGSLLETVHMRNRKGGRIVLVVTLVVAGCIVVLLGLLLGLLLLLSPGEPRPVLSSHGSPIPESISEKIFVEIGGVRQGMFIKGSSADNPVLLYLHGGMPEYFLTQRYPTGLEELFTVCWWEQRGEIGRAHV